MLKKNMKNSIKSIDLKVALKLMLLSSNKGGYEHELGRKIKESSFEDKENAE